MTMYRHADEVADLAEALIETVHRHEQLDGVRIEYVFIDKAPTSGGRTILGRARKVTGLNAFLSARAYIADTMVKPAPYFVVEISYDTWLRLDDKQRTALVDHELCHLFTEFNESGEQVLGTRGHDLEEFVGIVQRHGFWKSDIAEFSIAVAEQLTLDISAVTRHIDGIGTVDHNGEVLADAADEAGVEAATVAAPKRPRKTKTTNGDSK